MFIIEKPYVSEYLIDTVINHDWIVLENSTLEESGIEDDAFRLWTSEKAANNYLMQEYPLIYSNSEYAVSWVLQNLPKSNTTLYIKTFKDKILFRETLKEMYPDFYFRSFEYLDINYVKADEFAYPLVIKPSIGSLSFGVHKVEKESDWSTEVKMLHKEIASNKGTFNSDIVNTKMILLEEVIKGDEYSIDAYYDRNGVPVILNIFQHVLKDDKDISDRLYITSAPIMVRYMSKFTMFLRQLGELLNIRNFPLQVEVSVTASGDIIPIEVNPLHFSNWCAADIAKYVWGFNVYECFNLQKHPDWNQIIANAGKQTYYYSLIDIPKDFPRSTIRNFNYNGYLSNFLNVIELRRVSFQSNPILGVVFGSMTSESELQTILHLDVTKYIN